MAKRVINQEMLDALVGLKIGDIRDVRRVVLDLDLSQEYPITVYVEKYGDPKDTIRILKAASKVDVILAMNDQTEVEQVETERI